MLARNPAKRMADPALDIAAPVIVSIVSPERHIKGRQRANPNLAATTARLAIDRDRDKETLATATRARANFDIALRKGQFLSWSLLFLGLVACAAGAFVHVRNVQKRHSDLIYDLDEKEKQNLSLVGVGTPCPVPSIVANRFPEFQFGPEA
jgi:hypothetical protein